MSRPCRTLLNAPSRRPIIRTGQSNICGGYASITSWPARLQFAQDPIRAHHYAFNGGTDIAESTAFHRVSGYTPCPSMSARGALVGNWGVDLADGLLGAGINAALIDYCIGGTSAAYWTPDATGTQYPAILEWLQVRLADLESPLDPILVHYQGEGGIGEAGTWADHMTTYVAALRTALSCPTMGVVVVQIPANSALGTSIRASQAAYVAGDARARLAYCEDTTYDPLTGPTDVHIDVASGRRLAIGPDSAGVVRSVTTCIKELLA